MRSHLIGNWNSPGSARPLAVLGLLVTSALAAACGGITDLKQSNPGQLDAASVYRPANAQLLTNGVLSDFECAYHRVVTASGLLSDELATAIASSITFDYDRRTMTGTHAYSGACGGAQQPGVYTSLARARGSADTTYARMSEWTATEVPNREQLLGRVAAYAGLSVSFLGEMMCTAAIDAGPELTSQQLFQEAAQRFDRAVTHAAAANDANTANLARLGRARVRLFQGDVAGARQDAETIPEGFIVTTTPASVDVRLQNTVFVHTHQSFFSTVDESFRGVTLDGGEPDPRVAVTSAGRNGSAGVPIFTPDKYATVTTPIPVARYAEAQLIIAEVLIAQNDLEGAAAAINNARNSGRTGMPQYDATGRTADEMRAQLVEERRRELFLEGRRLWDVRRLDLPLVPAPGSPYTAGGGVYGDQRCFPLPDVERNNNPNIS